MRSKVKEQLSDSLFNLLKNRNFSSLSITDICDNAKVTRMSFYRNFSSKEDIINYRCVQILEEIKKTCDFKNDSTESIIEKIFMNFLKYKSFFITLKKNSLMYCFHDVYMEYTSKVQNERRKANPIFFYNSFMTGGTFEVLNSWAQEGFKTSVDEIKKICLEAYR